MLMDVIATWEAGEGNSDNSAAVTFRKPCQDGTRTLQQTYASSSPALERAIVLRSDRWAARPEWRSGPKGRFARFLPAPARVGIGHHGAAAWVGEPDRGARSSGRTGSHRPPGRSGVALAVGLQVSRCARLIRVNLVAGTREGATRMAFVRGCGAHAWVGGANCSTNRPFGGCGPFLTNRVSARSSVSGVRTAPL